LVGVQGAGKSLAAKAVAGLWGLPLLRLDFACLYNKYFGETERNLREALRLAEQMAPCVLWMDEVEKGISGGDHEDRRLALGHPGQQGTQPALTDAVVLVATRNA
ncbi:AAA family ATPase, partial [Pseudomonas aeruginosa]